MQAHPTTARIGKRGTVVLPGALRKQFDLHDGDLLVAEAHADGILLRPAMALPVEIYSTQRQVEFLLANAVGDAELRVAMADAAAMGVDAVAVAAAIGLRLPQP